VVVAGCGSTTDATRASLPTTPPTLSSNEVVLLTHDSFAVSKDVIADFTRRTGVKVTIVQAGDAGEVVNKAILAKGNPQGDVLFGLDTTFLGRARAAGILSPHRAAGLDQVDPALVPEGGIATPVDRGDVCVNLDEDYFADRPRPTSLDDLIDPRFKGLTVVQNPATSSPGLSFLLATIATQGEEGWQDWWRALTANDVRIVDGWEAAYYGQFSGGSGEGTRPIVVSYATSPAAEMTFADPVPASPPTSALVDTCFRQVEYAAVLDGAEHEDAARALIDYMLTDRFQRDVPQQMFVYPVVDGTVLPDAFEKYASVPEDPIVMDEATIDADRERWLREWRAVVEG
jgi:thiamine transport system substrate-binding protein